MIFLKICAWLFFCAGIYVLVNVLLNGSFFRILGHCPKPDQDSLVSVIIPARNEEENLPVLLESLIAQTYRNIEILVINDQSTDSTQQVIDSFEKRDSRIHGYKSDPNVKLCKNGKINAMIQLIPHASGEFLLNTDADTILDPKCIEYALSILKKRNIDMISGFPYQNYPDYRTGTTLSAMMLSSTMVPHWLNWFIQIPQLTVAIGQFVMMRKSAYEETGGYSAVGNVVCDDMAISRMFVRKKKRFAFVDLSGLIRCNMYVSKSETYYGIGRSIGGLFKTTPPFLALILFAMTVVLILASAPAFTVINFAVMGKCFHSWISLAGTICFWLGWYIAERFAGYTVLVSASYPLTFVYTLDIVIRSMYTKLSKKKVYWKNREVDL